MSIYAVKTVAGRERFVMELLEKRKRAAKALVHPAKLKGYIMVEGNLQELRRAVKDLRYAKGIIQKPIDRSEIEHFFERREIKIEVDKGDKVEITGGPFKGEKGRVKRIDKSNFEVTVELLEVAVPMPVTIDAGSVRILEKGKS